VKWERTSPRRRPHADKYGEKAVHEGSAPGQAVWQG
jgi:hypothetical protein